jgi:hypothetical protein
MRQLGRLGLAASMVIVLAAASSCAGGGGSGSKGLDGVYRMQTTYADAIEDPQPAPENYGNWIFVLDHGRLAFTQEYRDACTWGYGRYTVKGDEMDWRMTDGGGIAPTGAENRAGEHFRFRWSRYHDTLTLRPVKHSDLPEYEISPTNFRVKPWHVVSATPSRRYFPKKCPPPKAALP